MLRNCELISSRSKGYAVPAIGLVLVLTGCAGSWIQIDGTDVAAPRASTESITHISLSKSPGSVSVQISGNAPLKYSSVKQADPLGVVLIFPGTGLNTEGPASVPGNDIVDQVKAVELAGGDPLSKVEILLKRDAEYNISAAGTDLIVSFAGGAGTASSSATGNARSHASAEAVSAAPIEGAPTPPQPDHYEPEPRDADPGKKGGDSATVDTPPMPDVIGNGNSIKQVSYTTNETGRLSIVIETGLPVQYEVRPAGRAELRVVLMGTRLPGPLSPLEYESAAFRVTPGAAAGTGGSVSFEITCRERTPYFVEREGSVLTVHLEPPPIGVSSVGGESTTAGEEAEGGQATDPLVEIHRFLSDWRTAWENTAGEQGDMESYISYYSDDFTARGLDKDSWKQDKRTKNSKRSWIRGEIGDVVIEKVGDGGRYNARFSLDYTSPNYSELLRKTLILVRDATGWKIIGEKSRLASPEEREEYQAPKTNG